MEFLLDFILHIDQYMIDIVQEYHTWAYVILFIIIFCETGLVVTPFLPGDSLLFVAGAISALPDMPLEVNILALVLFLSAVLGDSCNYMIGHFFGNKLFNNPDSRIFKQSHLEKTHEFYKKYGGKTIIIARFVEGGNLAASKIRNLECPSYEICLIDYGCGKFNRKIHIMEQYP